MKFDKELFKKIGMSAVVTAGFLFFWINGPIEVVDESISLREHETPFSKPMMFDQKTVTQKEYGAIDTEHEKFYGGSLILNHKKEEHETSGILISPKSDDLKSVEATDFLNHAKKLFPEGESFQIIESTDLYFIQFSYNGEQVFYTESGPFIKGIMGYAGEINVGVLYNADGEVIQADHIDSHETESYLADIKKAGYYQQYDALAFNHEHQVDGVSGATITSKTFAETVTALSDLTGPQLPLSIDFHDFLVQAELTLWWILDIAIIVLLFAYGVFKRIKSKRNTRIVQIASVLYIGFFLNASFSYTAFIQPFTGTSLSLFLGMYAFLTLIGSIWEKNIYCKYVCPFGCAQKLATQASKPFIKTSKFPISNKWLERLRDTVTIGLVVGVLLGLRNWGNFELFPDLFSVDFGNTYLYVSLAFILINLKYPMLWCRTLCPTGAILDRMSDLAHHKQKVTQKQKTVVLQKPRLRTV